MRCLRAGHQVTAIVRDPEKAERLTVARRHALSSASSARRSVRLPAIDGADAVIHTALRRARRAASRRIARRSKRSSRALPSGGQRRADLHLHLGRLGAGHDDAGRWTKTAPLDPADYVAWRPAHEQLVLDAGANGLRTVVVRPGDRLRRLARHRVGPAEGRAERAGARDRAGQESLADRLRSRSRPSSTCGCCRRRTRAGIFHANDEGDERVNDIVEAIADHLTQRPDVRHMPMPEARRKLGTYADALALDQRVRSPRPRRSAGRRRCPASPRTSRGCSKSTAAARR